VVAFTWCEYNPKVLTWAAARAFCREKGWRFKIWDEKTIDILRQKADYWLNIHHQNINRLDEGS